MNKIPSKYKKLVERARTGTSRADSIHANCLECQGWLREQVRDCKTTDCWFHKLRPYKTPQEISGTVKKRQIKKIPASIGNSRLSKVIEIKNPPDGKYRLRVELVPEKKI